VAVLCLLGVVPNGGAFTSSKVSTAGTRGCNFGVHPARERVGGALVPIETNYTPSHMLCPKCGKLMRLVAIEPSPSAPSTDAITYQCAFCNHEENRIRRADDA
jgi:hypothetical protein